MDRVNVHGYQYEKGRRDAVYAAVAGKPLWNSEYGDPDATGAKLRITLSAVQRVLSDSADGGKSS